HITDMIATRDALSDLDAVPAVMGVDGLEAEIVLYADHVPVAALPAGSGDDAVRGRMDRRALRRGEIHTRMMPAAPQDRVAAVAEGRGEAVVIEHRHREGDAVRRDPQHVHPVEIDEEVVVSRRDLVPGVGTGGHADIAAT